MAEVPGYGRLPFPRGRLRTAQVSPGYQRPAATPYLTEGYLFPSGVDLADGTAPNQAIRWGFGDVNQSDGAAITVACVPGRQYTASAYIKQGVTNTLGLSISNITATDTFNRTTANGWDTADSGQTWSVSAPSGDYSTGGGLGTMSVSAIGSRTATWSGPSLTDVSLFMNSIACNVLPSGNNVEAGARARVNGSDLVEFRIFFNTDNTVTCFMRQTLGGINTDTATVVVAGATCATTLSARWTVSGGQMQLRVWAAGTVEPAAWTVTLGSVAQTTQSAILLRTAVNAGYTGTLPAVFTFGSIALIGSQVGTVINRPLEWARLSVTFTATQPTHAFTAQTVGPSVPGVGFMDDVQLEIGASASAFVTTGAVIYPVMRNYVERWPRKWSAAGFEGYVEAPCVDGFGAINAITLSTEYTEAVLATKPDLYWRLNDGTGSTSYLEQSGNRGPTIINAVSKYGSGTAPAPGTTMGIPGDPGGTGVTFVPAAGSAGTILGTGPIISSATQPVSIPPVIGTSWALSAAAWVKVTANANNQYVISTASVLSNAGDFSFKPIQLEPEGGTGASILYRSTDGVSVFLVRASSGLAITDGTLHHIAGVVTQDATNTIQKIYVDGVLRNTVTTSTATLGGILPRQATTLTVGGSDTGTTFIAELNGAASHASLWYRALSDAEVADLWNAGLGYAGETTGTRIARHLTRGGYTGTGRISVGQSTMQAASWTGTINLLTDSQDTAVAEQGTIWMAPDGAFVFESRNDRFLRLTSTYTLGENPGESPYLDDIEMDYDPQYVYSDVAITRNGAGLAFGGTAADVSATAKKYFPRSYQANVDLSSNALTQDMADWIFNTHKAALLRVATITLDPSSNLSLWPVALGLEIGTRITVIRRAKAANGGAGLAISGDFFVEQITHDNIDMATGEWTTTLYVSPVGAAPGVTFQPWILENATYGVLNSTTILAF